MPNAGRKAAGLAESSVDMLRPTIRTLVPRDIPDVLAIEQRSFRAPWSSAMFQIELARPGTVALALEVEGRLVGYSVLTKLADAWHLMNIAIDPAYRRLGLALDLVSASLEQTGDSAPVTLEVRASNRPAIALYERLGFRRAGRRPGYYPDDGEDALVMWRGDPSAAGVPGEALGAI